MTRVLTARFMHETNTFSRVPTDMALIRRRDFHLENEIPQAFRGTRSALGATFEAADKYGWSLVHPVSANPNPSGIVTDDAFEHDHRDDPRRLRAERPDRRRAAASAWRDGHRQPRGCGGRIAGATAAQARAEAPIVVTLDLHANVTQNDGRQRQRADRLPHLSACRHVRARLAGRGAARTRDAGRDPAGDRDRAPADDLRARSRPPPKPADGRAACPRRCDRTGAAKRWRSASAPGSAAPISAMSARR